MDLPLGSLISVATVETQISLEKIWDNGILFCLIKLDLHFSM